MTDDHPVDLDMSRGMAAEKASDRMDTLSIQPNRSEIPPVPFAARLLA